jgi:hypothetical protein
MAGKNSRWKKGNDVPRYPKALEPVLARYREQPGWFHGARVTKSPSHKVTKS